MDQSLDLNRVKEELAPTGVLRAAINMSNFLLVTAKAANGDPIGVSPELAKTIADKLGVGLQLLTFKGPGELADAAADDVWDIGNIAEEAERAKVITFSPAYCEIQATYLLPANSGIKSIQDVDKPGVKIAVKGRSAYDLWLTENLKHATLVRTETIDESFDVFVRDNLDVLSGLRPKLIDNHAQLPGSVLLEESFTAIQQAVGCRPGREHAAAFIKSFVAESIENGLIAGLIKKHGVEGRLSVAPQVAA